VRKAKPAEAGEVNSGEKIEPKERGLRRGKFKNRAICSTPGTL
jgi:hypothetical protein